jgi:hypothetical protein
MNRKAEKRYFARKCTDIMPVPRIDKGSTMSWVDHHSKQREHRIHNYLPYGNGKTYKYCKDCNSLKKI